MDRAGAADCDYVVGAGVITTVFPLEVCSFGGGEVIAGADDVGAAGEGGGKVAVGWWWIVC